MAVSRTRQLPIGVTQIDKADGIQTGQVTVDATGGGTVVLFGTEFSATPRMVATDTDSAAGVIAITTLTAGSFTIVTATAGTVDYIAMLPNE